MFDSANPPTPATLTLSDGRTLAWYELGDPDGLPVVYNPGSPSGGLIGALYDDTARAAAIRLISLDKPGFGYSDFQPERTLAAWAKDIEQLADHLGLARFATIGESGGGPYALALAAGIPDRLNHTHVIAGVGPDWGDDPDKKLLPDNRRLADAMHDPAAIERLMLEQQASLDNPVGRWEKILAALPPVDRAVWASNPAAEAILTASGNAAFRNGVAGAVAEITAFARWDLDLAAISAHVDLWYGTEDRNVPISAGYTIAELLPNRTTHWLDNVGHAIGQLVMADILASIRKAPPGAK